MMVTIKSVEEYRLRNGLKKADMARAFGVSVQTYNNWVYRDSLPKEALSTALKLLGESGMDFKSTALSPIQSRLISMLELEFQAGNLNDHDAEVIHAFIKGRMSTLGKKLSA